MIRLIGENSCKVCNDSFGLNIWWSLERVRDTSGWKILICFFCLGPTYPKFIENRLKQSMPIKIA
jgi:hypothetical protein